MKLPEAHFGAPGPADYVLLLILALIYGSAFLFIKFAVIDFTPVAIVTLRVAFAAAIFVVLAVASARPPEIPSNLWKWLVLSGLLANALPFFLIAWGQERVDSGLAAILMAPMPLATLIFAHFFSSDEPLVPRKVAGILLGIAGITVLVGVKALADLGSDLVRQLAILSAGLCYALNAVITKRFVSLPSRWVLAIVMTMSVLWMLPAAMLSPWLNQAPTATSITAVAILAILHTAIGALLMFTLVRRQGAGFFGQINIMVPIVGALLGAILLAEPLGVEAWIALALIMLGVIIARGGGGKKSISDQKP